MMIFKKWLKTPLRYFAFFLFFLSLLPFSALADFDGNGPKTYILGTTPAEKQALQQKRNGTDVPIPASKPEFHKGQRIDLNRNPLFDEAEKNEPRLEHRLLNPGAKEILQQIQ